MIMMKLFIAFQMLLFNVLLIGSLLHTSILVTGFIIKPINDRILSTMNKRGNVGIEIEIIPQILLHYSSFNLYAIKNNDIDSNTISINGSNIDSNDNNDGSSSSTNNNNNNNESIVDTSNILKSVKKGKRKEKVNNLNKMWLKVYQ